MKSREKGRLSCLELYIHIPFCVRKCAYCDFLSFPSGEEERERYVECLTEEIEEAGAVSGRYVVTAIFLGGGTPSVLTPEQTKGILEAVKKSFYVAEDAEITTEANPGTADGNKFRAWKQAGINRLSFGLQSTENKELQCLGRIHTMEDFLESYQAAREAGFDNINIDLMSALPGQTVSSWEKTLRTVVKLRPEHISAYSLIIEEGTPFYRLFGGDGDEMEEQKRRQTLGIPDLPDEDAERRMYYETERILKEAGYHRYEISNYAKPGYECCHNKGYWTGTEYLGLGLGASSYVNRRGEIPLSGETKKEDGRERQMERRSNIRDFKTYLSLSREDFRAERQVAEREILTEQARMEEFMFLGLRLTEGISEERFFRLFGRSLDDVYGKVLNELTCQELIEQYERDDTVFWRLTKRGIDVSNYVLAEFLME
ncbi:MAG: radical SAM family heme chaperone HemW [Clostridium sp.]|nr:radical SAM family heme chaperone HemW [Clostridium sp.]